MVDEGRGMYPKQLNAAVRFNVYVIAPSCGETPPGWIDGYTKYTTGCPMINIAIY